MKIKNFNFFFAFLWFASGDFVKLLQEVHVHKLWMKWQRTERSANNLPLFQPISHTVSRCQNISPLSTVKVFVTQDGRFTHFVVFLFLTAETASFC